jgi:hypothetical protein
MVVYSANRVKWLLALVCVGASRGGEALRRVAGSRLARPALRRSQKTVGLSALSL